MVRASTGRDGFGVGARLRRKLIERRCSHAGVLERLKAGKRCVTGQRKEFLASTFDFGKPVKALGQDSRQVVTTLSASDHDELEGVPVF